MASTTLALLAAAALQGAPAAEPNTVSPVTVTATKPAPADATVNVAGGDEFSGDYVAVWPGTAYQAGDRGEVTLACFIDIHGLAERCRVASETPQRKRFGEAALALRPTFLLKPATGPDGRPMGSTMSIKVRFEPPRNELVGNEGTNAGIRSLSDTQNFIRAMKPISGNPLAMRKVTRVDDPVWVAAAGFEDLAGAYPAEGGGVQGYAAVQCRVEREAARAGELHHCQVIKESPKQRGFGAAALALAPKFRVSPAAIARAPRGAPLWVDIPIRMPPPAEVRERAVTSPIWTVGLDPDATPRVFPPEATASGLTSGRGIARCTVAADGAMTGCVPEPGEPDGLGFSEAAVKLASGLRMNLWSADGVPVAGGEVRIPIRLNLKGAAN